MHTDSIAQWQHTHIFGQDKIRSGEQRTLIVIIITALMMIVEIVTGMVFGSMALFADGIHMGSHMVGLGISFMAYIYARKHAHDQAYSFGTGKVNALAGYSSAIFLVIIALYMGYESIHRIINPVRIEYNQAILVAVIGLVVNGASMFILGERGHDHTHDAENEHNGSDHVHEHAPDLRRQADLTHAKGADHNLKAAYLHVLTDAMTSILAIAALLGAKYFKLNWMDPLMGIVGAILVIRWSFGLIQGTMKVLLDHQIAFEVQKKITAILEGYKDTRVSDMHIWSIGPGIYSAEISLVTSFPESPSIYKNLIPHGTGVVHSTIEVNLCPD
ncbi:MAG TPA: CDF family Co(II)/Ni(II) efflux transporter DmeF [Anaerolineales bacterium]|nr:CDF family Co(II)/Ni(II) efflux transporter DmeF [Anaerolineales bacterium]